jgi:hypothetical protein
VKTGVFRPSFFLLGSLLAATLEGHGAAPCTLNLQPASGKMLLSWPATMETVDLGVIYPEYTVEQSSDLQHWQPISGKLRGLRRGMDPRLNLSVDPIPGAGFFRVNAEAYSRAPQTTGAGGSEVFGCDTRFADELNWLGLIPVEALVTNFPQPSYLSQMDFDPTTAQFWSAFNTNAAFQLNSNELAAFLTNGFVVSERLGSVAPSSFGGLYYRVFHGDLPVFVTTNSILPAWHRTYLNMLEEIEELELATLQEQILTNMAAQLQPA